MGNLRLPQVPPHYRRLRQPALMQNYWISNSGRQQSLQFESLILEHQTTTTQKLFIRITKVFEISDENEKKFIWFSKFRKILRNGHETSSKCSALPENRSLGITFDPFWVKTPLIQFKTNFKKAGLEFFKTRNCQISQSKTWVQRIEDEVRCIPGST